MGGFEGREGKEEIMELYYNLKTKRNNYQNIMQRGHSSNVMH